VPKFWAKTNLIGPLLPKKMKLWRFLKIEGSVLMYIVPPLWPTYIGESAKAYKSEVLIWGTYWGTHCELGEHFWNPLGT